MITPLFKVEQDNEFIYVKAHLKYVKFSDFDWFIEGNNFRFSVKPYHLNLYFSDNFNPDSEHNSSKYDITTQMLTCTIEKEKHGTFFTNLEMLSTLLENQATCGVIKIAEIQTSNDTDTATIHETNAQLAITSEEELNSFLFNKYTEYYSQKGPCFNLLLTNNCQENFNYGFNNSFNDVFDQRQEDLIELCDLNPKKVEKRKRFFCKMEKENFDFVPERYVADMNLENDTDEEHFSKCFLLDMQSYIQSISNQSKDSFPFDEKELQMLQDINKAKLSLLSDGDIYFHFYLQCLDILFSFCYDLTTTEFEHSSESGWTINKISAVFSNLVDFDLQFFSHSEEISFEILSDLVKHVMISSYRRVLVYPLYRNIRLSQKIQKDLSFLLNSGKFALLKMFLQVKIIFEKSEPRHLLNKMYVDHYIKWIQVYSDQSIWQIIGNVVSRIKIEKQDLKLDLEEYESEYDL